MPLNAAGRDIPDHIAGYGPTAPYAGAFATTDSAHRGAPLNRGEHTPGRDKRMPDLRAALEAAGLRDGMTVSFHHHLRNGDAVMNLAMHTIAEMGVGDITLAPCILFDVHGPLVELARRGVIRTVHGCMTGPMGPFASTGGLNDTAILRSHGGRARAVIQGEMPIDIAIIAAPCADARGNANGVHGPAACGPLSFNHADAMHAKKVIVVTDHLVPYPAVPISIAEHHVDHVVKVDSIGDPAGIVSGITQVSAAGPHLSIARTAADVLWHSGLVREGFNFQAGAGGISLAAVRFLGRMMAEHSIHADWVMGGINQSVLELFSQGLVKKMLDCQAFDLPAVQSLRDDAAHVEISVDQYANPHNKGCVCHQLDAIFLGGTEVDLDFNVNVNTHSDGRVLRAIGGHQDTAAGAKLTIITVPVARKTHPIVLDRVTNVTTPGDAVDVIATDLGVAINPQSPRHADLTDRLSRTDIPVLRIEQLRDAALQRAGQPYQPPRTTDRIIAVIQWRDGTVLDVVRAVQKR